LSIINYKISSSNGKVNQVSFDIFGDAEDILFRRSKLGLIMPEMGLKKLNLSLEAYNADTHISPKGKSLKMQKVRPA